MKLRYLFALALVCSATAELAADENRKGLADKHAPAGVMGDHLHGKGEFMVEYRYMNMYMDGNRIGTRRVGDAEALGPPGPPPGIVVDGIRTNGGATPTQMTMEMHMMHLMYGASDDVTLYTMLMFPSLTMDHLRGDGNPAGRGTPFTTHNSGFGDMVIGGLIRLCGDEKQDLIFNLAGSVPTGNLYRETTNPTGGLVLQPLPYPMRLGSGTFNARPGITYKRFFELWSFGSQLQMDFPIGRNYRGYSVGDEYRLNNWIGLLLTDSVALSVRSEQIWRSPYDGTDPQADNIVISTNVEAFRGGFWTNIGIGMQAMKCGHYFNFEIVPTIAQDLDGIQLETDWSVIGSWSKAW